MARKKKAVLVPNHPDFPDKWAKSLPTGWADLVDGMKKEEMEKTIIDCEKAISSTEKDRSDDTKLQAAKDDVSLLDSAYKEVLNTQKAKIKLLLHVMNERGYA